MRSREKSNRKVTKSHLRRPLLSPSEHIAIIGKAFTGITSRSGPLDNLLLLIRNGTGRDSFYYVRCSKAAWLLDMILTLLLNGYCNCD